MIVLIGINAEMFFRYVRVASCSLESTKCVNLRTSKESRKRIIREHLILIENEEHSNMSCSEIA